ncbi:MAG: general secretion pathway protein GspB [Mariprofundus sp.]|nr:general secretion pathway protein GspB [Mariprofundus sp.]
MSYILDALNKSESIRTSKKRPPMIHTNPETVIPAKGQRKWLFILLTCALLPWLWFAGSSLISSDKEKIPRATTAPSVMPMLIKKKQETAMQLPLKTTEPLARSELPSSPNKQAITPSTLSLSEERAILQNAVIAKEFTTTPSQPDTADANIPDRSHLSLSEQASLPDVHIEGHIYDKIATRRMVIINGQVRHEKQNIENGLILEEITSDGVILNYNGTVFHIGTFD